MKNAFVIFLLAVFAVSPGLSQSADTGTTKTATSSATSSSTPKKGKSGKKKTSATVAGSSFRSRQGGPTPERYREIQQALVEKGYLKSEPDGVWDAECTDALRQFQTDQKLTPTGKITAATLISLGLGPKDSEGGSNAAFAEIPPSSR